MPRAGARVDELTRPAAGWSSETVIVRVSWEGAAGRDDERLVVRLPLLVPSYPSYDLALQAEVLGVLGAAGIPVPRVVATDDDTRWLGAPFLVMSFVSGRPVGDVPAFDDWLASAPVERQRAVHERFFVSLAAVHSVEWQGTTLPSTLRLGIAAEIDYWMRYVHWAADGAPARVLVDALEWCATTAPSDDSPQSLLWGDARLGNVMFDEHPQVVALLDWELATIGPAEMDLAWHLALDELTTSFVGQTVPGFLSRAEAIRCYEHALGREATHLAWHEVFALARSVAINDRQARLAATTGTPYPGVAGDDNPVLAYLDDRIASFEK
jgi:aminoglycoside phosphotransferase (APT) family kinase protein